jgi:SAM-dependent methyltransferase
MLDLAKVTPKDYVIDLGSGDGRTVIAAAKRGAVALGIEYNPDMVELSIRNAAQAGVSDKATFVNADLFESDLSKATVITMFLLPDLNIRLRPRLLNLKPGTRIVSNSFAMEDWQSDGVVRLENGCSTWCTAYLWIIPAKVEGKWRMPEGEITINQQFQMISGTLATGRENASLSGKVNGDQITFSAGGAEYSGQLDGDALSGTVKRSWQATREK